MSETQPSRALKSTGTLKSTTQRWKISNERANKNGPRPTVYWTSGEQYKGEWLNNLKHGVGVMIYKNSDKYEGEWAEDVRYGLGIYWIFHEGRFKVRYNGSWQGDLPHGEGVLFADNGDVYQGEFVSGMRHGRGKQVYANEDIYEGDWLNDKRHGRGTLAKKNGDVYEGLWAGDVRQGEGTFYFVSQNTRYDGVWVDDLPKCGEYTEIQDMGPGAPSSLPTLELANPKGVYRGAKQDAAVLITQNGGVVSNLQSLAGQDDDDDNDLNDDDGIHEVDLSDTGDEGEG